MKNNNFFILAVLNFVLISCSSSYVNEYGRARPGFDFAKIKPNTNDEVYQIIDTSRLYKLVDITVKSDSRASYDMNGINNSNPSYLKFYGNGRVGEFRNVDFGRVETLNPKDAQSNLYNFKNNKFIVQFFFEAPQCGECFVKGILTKVSNDTIKIIRGDYVETYKAIKIPPEFLIYKPDW